MPTNNNFGILNTGIIDFAGANSPGWVSNLGCTLSGGTFSITDAGGAALSATNPAWVTLPSQTAGQLISIKVVANQNFIDDAGASEIIGNTFGATTTIAWGNDCPFYIYAVPNDAETAIAFMISRIPHATRSPVAAAIGAPDDAVATAAGDFFAFDNLDETLYDDNPCVCIGSIRMRMAVTTDDWTVQTLTDQDGIGRFHEETFFTMPLAQNGAATGTFFLANGGTAPLFTTNLFDYKVSKNGICDCFIYLLDDPGTDGAGAVTSRISLPLLSDLGAVTEIMTSIAATNSATGSIRSALPTIEDNVSYFFLTEPDGTSVQNGDFGNGARHVITGFSYPIAGPSAA